jgi:hypothetical protein
LRGADSSEWRMLNAQALIFIAACAVIIALAVWLGL